MSAARPLAGLKVLELGALIAGPFCAKILAEFGAEVVKIEPPGQGDPLRKWRYVKDGTSVWWHVQSRNKQSVALDLRKPEGQAIARELALARRHRRREFPARHARGLGPGLRRARRRESRARHGAHLRLRPDRPLSRAAGLRRHRRGDGRPAPRHRHARPAAVAHRHLDRRHAVRAVRRHRRDDGARVAAQDRPRAGRRRRALRIGVLGDGVAAARVRRLRRRARAHRLDPAGHRADLGLSLQRRQLRADRARNADSIFKRLCSAMGRDDLADDASLAHNDGRAARQAWLDGEIEAWTSARSPDDVLAAMEAAEVPASKIYSIADIAADPHYAAREMIRADRAGRRRDAEGAGRRAEALGHAGRLRRRRPALGEHTDAVLRSPGYDDQRIGDFEGVGHRRVSGPTMQVQRET